MEPATSQLIAADNVVDRETKRVLLISYHFPPVGGAGVQRPLKFVKYLKRFGWEVSVLMAENPSVPVFDESLCKDLPEDLVIEKARTWEPDYRFKRQVGPATDVPVSWISRLKNVARRCVGSAVRVCLQPDAQILWLPNAKSAALRLLNRIPHHAILATAPPYSNLLLGSKLKRLSGLPLVVDYRDEWDLSSKYLENSQRDWFSRLLQDRMQRNVLCSADAIIATTEGSTSRLQDRASLAGSKAQAHCIYNGFDPSDFQGVNQSSESTRASSSRFRIVYTGTLWTLTTVLPVVEAIETLHRDVPELLSRLELMFVGRRTPEQHALLQRLAVTRANVIIRDYCPHSEALQLMAGADCLCLLLSDVPGAERVAPAKLFEYLALRKPVLGITPEGETAQIVRRFFPRNHFVPGNVAGIANWLTDQLAVFPSIPQTSWDPVPEANLDAFTREYQTGQLVRVLNEVARAQSRNGK